MANIFFHADGINRNDILAIRRRQIFAGYRGNNISMIFQEPMTSLNPVITCGEQVMKPSGCTSRFLNRKQAEKTLQLV